MILEVLPKAFLNSLPEDTIIKLTPFPPVEATGSPLSSTVPKYSSSVVAVDSTSSTVPKYSSSVVAVDSTSSLMSF